MAFGNKLLPCAPAASGGSSLLGRQAFSEGETEGDPDIEGRHVCDGPDEFRGQARSPAGTKTGAASEDLPLT